MSVAAEIGDYLFGTAKRRFGIDDPPLAANGGITHAQAA
jgi:hypothetical protein